MKAKKGKPDILPLLPITHTDVINREMHNSEEVLAELRSLTRENADKKKEKLNLEIQVSKQTKQLSAAYSELIFENTIKEKRAAELVIANTELAFQNQEKEDRAAELVAA
ncbi:MAG: hypothetical protein ABI581_02515, partial [Sediminibacterium sp.]